MRATSHRDINSFEQAHGVDRRVEEAYNEEINRDKLVRSFDRDTIGRQTAPTFRAF